MRALQLLEWEKAPVYRDVPVPEPGYGQVLIRVGGAGACHSDLHIMEWPAGTMPYRLPFTLGHENAGWVEKTGPGVDNFSVGDPVVVYGPWGCGNCYRCRQGMENYCENSAVVNGGAHGGGLGLDGGMAEYMLVPSGRFLVPLTTLDPKEAAPITDAGLTPYHAIKRSLLLLGPRATAVVIGVGGLGHMAIQILRAVTCARIVAMDVVEDKLRLAAQMGADVALLSNEESLAEIGDLTRGQGAAVVLDMVGSSATMALAARMAGKGGSITIIGAGNGTLSLGFSTLPTGCSIGTSYWGSLPELIELVDLCEKRGIRSHNIYYPLDRAHEAYESLKAGSVQGRAVIVPNAERSDRS